MRDGTGSKGVIGDYALPIADYIGAGSAGGLIRPCTTSEPVVQNRFTGIEAVNLMIVRQGLRCGKRLTHSHGGGVCMLLSSRLFGFGGASRRARNRRYALGLTVKIVRSSKVSSAARSGGVEDEIRTVLSNEFRGTINQFADLRSDAKIEGLALSRFALCGTHMVS